MIFSWYHELQELCETNTFLCFLYFVALYVVESFSSLLVLVSDSTTLLHYAPYFAPCDVANRVFMWSCVSSEKLQAKCSVVHLYIMMMKCSHVEQWQGSLYTWGTILDIVKFCHIVKFVNSGHSSPMGHSELTRWQISRCPNGTLGLILSLGLTNLSRVCYTILCVEKSPEYLSLA